MDAPHSIGVIGRMLIVLRKPDRVGQFVQHLVDGNVNAECVQPREHGDVKARHRFSGEHELPLGTVARRNAQGVVDEIEVDLEGRGDVATTSHVIAPSPRRARQRHDGRP